MAMIPNLVPHTDSGNVADKVLIWEDGHLCVFHLLFICAFYSRS